MMWRAVVNILLQHTYHDKVPPQLAVDAPSAEAVSDVALLVGALFSYSSLTWRELRDERSSSSVQALQSR